MRCAFPPRRCARGWRAAVANAYISTQRDDGSISNVLTQLVDVDNISSITMAGRWYTGNESEGVDVAYEYVAP